MKKTTLKFFLVLALVPFLTQCASQDEIHNLALQLRMVNKKVEDMRSGTFGQLQKRQALSSGQIDQLHKEILELKGQLEETAHLNRRLKEQNKELEASIKLYTQNATLERKALLQQYEQRDQEKEAKIAQLRQSVSAIEQRSIDEAKKLAAQKKRAAAAAEEKARLASRKLAQNSTTIPSIRATKKKRMVSPPRSTASEPVKAAEPKKLAVAKKAATPAKKAVAAPTKSADTDILAQAKSAYNKGDYDTAVSLYERYTNQYTSGEEYIDALYMLGECRFKQKMYDEAIRKYNLINTEFPNHPKTPKALLRMALVFEKLHDNDETVRMVYQNIIKRFGSSPEAAVAKEKIADL